VCVCVTEDSKLDRRADDRVDRHDSAADGRAVRSVARTSSTADADVPDSDANYARATAQGS